MINDIFSRAGENDTLGSVLRNQAKANLQNLHVASLCRFNQVSEAYTSANGYGVATVTPVALAQGETEYSIEAYFFSDIDFTNVTYVLVVFTDIDFRTGLKSGETKASNNKTYHSRSFGVLITL